MIAETEKKKRIGLATTKMADGLSRRFSDLGGLKTLYLEPATLGRQR